MKKGNNTQEAGNNATQIQANTINVGLKESEVRDIVSNEIKYALGEMRLLAVEETDKRLNNYANVYIPKLVDNALLDSFAKPQIQMLFRKTEKVAACTDKEKDYEILSELLIHRAKKDGNYITSAAISKSIDEVENLSDEAIMCLTVRYIVQSIMPKQKNVTEGLNTINKLYKTIIQDNILPNDNNWIDNLELSNAIKTDNISETKSFEEYYYERFSGYSSLGIKKDSEEYEKACKVLSDNGIPKNFLIENEFNSDYVKLPLVNLNDIDSLGIEITLKSKDKLTTLCFPFDENKKKAIQEVIKLYIKKEDKQSFTNLLKSYEYINKVMSWWNEKRRPAINITPIGRVLAHVNAKCSDSTFPDLD